MCKKRLRMDHLHNFFRNFLGETTPSPPPLLRENKKKTLPSWDLFDPLQLRWKFSHITYIGNRRFEGKITHIFFFLRNQHELCKKRAENTPFASITKKKKFGEIPNPRPYCEKIKNSLLGFIWSSKAEVLILPHIVYRSFEGKNYTQFWRSNQHELRKKKVYNASFVSIFQKCSRGSPRAPTCSRGIHSRTFPKAALIWLPPPPPPKQ